MASLPAAGLLQAKKKGAEDLSNMIIQGENRLRVEPKVPAVDWDPMIYRDVQGVLQDYALIGELTPPSIEEPPVVLPEKSATAKAASPWLERIHEPPILFLGFKVPEDAAKSPSEWAFLVKDSNGQVFYELKGKKALPKEVVWEGFSGKNEPLHVGYDYSYSFSSTDEGGNPHRYAGKPFRIDAFRHGRSGRSVASFQPEVLFEGRSSLKISKDGTDYLTEAKDFLRGRYGSKIEVACYEEDAKFAQFRARTIRDFLLKALDLAEDLITAEGFPIAKGGGYRHVDVIAK